MDLLSLVLTLRPLGRPNPQEPLPPWWGRAAHALLLNAARQYDPALAASLHDGQTANEQISDSKRENAVRPFTVSTLMGRFPGGNLDLERPYALRMSAFREDLATILWEAARSGPLSPSSVVELDYLKFRVEWVMPSKSANQQPVSASAESGMTSKSATNNQQSVWAQATSYQDLGAAFLLAKQPAQRRVSLQFTSPTTFKSGGMHVPIPLPELTFGSLLERWNAYAPIAFPVEVKRYAAECLAVGYYKLSSRAVPMKRGGLRVGGVGEVSYTSLNYDRYWMSVIGALAAFALFSGVGAGTTNGMGQCRQVQRMED